LVVGYYDVVLFCFECHGEGRREDGLSVALSRLVQPSSHACFIFIFVFASISRASTASTSSPLSLANGRCNRSCGTQRDKKGFVLWRPCIIGVHMLPF
jgi:hypothetical protein